MSTIEKLIDRYRNDHNIIYQLSVKKLEKLYTHAKDLYYDGEESFMTDQEFDIIEAQLKELDPDNTLLKQVGAPTKNKDNTVNLPYWMGSLNKITDEKAVDKWINQNQGNVVIMEKLDGASILLRKNGDTDKIEMFGRGDDGVGQELSDIVPYLPIPNLDKIEGEFAVRCEILISNENYDKFGIVSVEEKNPRPVSTGLINAKHPDKKLLQYLSLVAYEQVYPLITINKGLKNLKRLGFEVVRNKRVSNDITCSFLQETLLNWRKESNYCMDGLVIFHDVPYERVWGQKYPKYATAFKDPDQMEKKEVVVIKVTWKCSKDSYLKPTIFYEPIRLNGHECNKATAHNARFVETNGIGPGAKIVVIKAGDVIPNVARVIAPSPNGPQMPECEYTWVTIGEGVDIEFASGSKEQLISILVHFSTKMDIEGLKEGKIRKLVDSGLVSSIEDLWKLNKKKLSKLNEGWGEQSTINLLSSLKTTKEKRNLSKLMAATNLFGRGLSDKSLELIVNNCPGDTLWADTDESALSVDTLLEIKGIGIRKATDFITGFPKFIEFLANIGLSISDFKEYDNNEQDRDYGDNKNLTGHTIVFTGVRPKDDMKEKIKQLGGKITGSVSNNTTIVVADLSKGRAGQNLNKARELGVIILSLEEFENQYLLV